MSADEKIITVATARVERETEKAILIVSKIRDFRKSAWVPKSVSNVLDGGMIEIAAWFAAQEHIQPIF